MSNPESTPTTEPAESLDDLRVQLRIARVRVDWLEATIASAEADEQASEPARSTNVGGVFVDPSESPSWCPDCNEDHGNEQPEPVTSPSDRDLIDALTTRVDALGAVFDKAALDETDAMLDMTGAFVSSTAAVLRIRAEIAMKHEQAKARWLAVQHGGRPAERARAMGRHGTWQEALRLVDRVIGERLS